MKQQQENDMFQERQGGVVFQHSDTGPTGWAVIASGGLIGLGLIIIALAIFALANWLGAALASLAQYIGIGSLFVSGGVFTFQACRGVALIVEAQGKAKALEKEAEGCYVASVRAARLKAPGDHYAGRH